MQWCRCWCVYFPTDPKDIEKARNRGTKSFPSAADICVVAVCRVVREGNPNDFYKEFIQTLDGDVKLADKLAERIVAAALAKKPGVDIGNVDNLLAVSPALAFDAGYVAAYAAGTKAKDNKLDRTKIRNPIEQCLAEGPIDAGLCASIGYGLGGDQFRAEQYLAESASKYRSGAQQFIRDVIDGGIYNKCLQFSSTADAMSFRDKSASRRQYMVEQLAHNTPEGNLNATGAEIGYMLMIETYSKPGCSK